MIASTTSCFMRRISCLQLHLPGIFLSESPEGNGHLRFPKLCGNPRHQGCETPIFGLLSMPFPFSGVRAMLLTLRLLPPVSRQHFPWNEFLLGFFKALGDDSWNFDSCPFRLALSREFSLMVPLLTQTRRLPINEHYETQESSLMKKQTDQVAIR